MAREDRLTTYRSKKDEVSTVSPMIMRIWRTEVHEDRAAEYERFAAEESLPMFQAHRGFGGLLFGRRGSECVVITLWADATAADELEASSRYQDTVARITATGFLTGQSHVERFDVHGVDPRWSP